MRLLYLIVITIAIYLGASCGRTQRSNQAVPGSDTGRAEIVFSQYEHSFGKIRQGEKVSWEFDFENRGTSDLVINAVLTTCGCTVTDYDAKPVAPGQKGSIDVVFDSTDKFGMQTKTITVRSNAKVPVIILKITAEVEQKQ